MVDFKDVFVQAFIALTNDQKLIDLLEIDLSDVSDENERMLKLRKSIIDAFNPDGILTEYYTRLCIHEEDGSYQGMNQEISYLAVDIHISKDKNEKDRRALQIMRRLIEVLDAKQRRKQGLPKLSVGLIGFRYKKHLQSKNLTNTGWEKYSVVFEYRFLI